MFDPTEALARAIARGEIDVPAYPSVAQKLRELVKSQRCTGERLSEVIRSDPALTARILRIANSAGMRPANGEVISITHAVGLLGTQQISQVALGAQVSEAVCADGPLRDLRYLVWRQSLCVAFMSQALAASRKLEPEATFLCGLLGGLARTVTLAYLERAAVSSKTPLSLTAEGWLELVNAHERDAGRLIAQKWQLPALIRQVVAGSPRAGGPPSRTSVAVLQLVTQVRAIFELLDLSPTLDEEALKALVPSADERRIVIDLVRSLPALIEPLGTPLTEIATSPKRRSAEPSLLATSKSTLPGVLHPVSFTVQIIKAKQKIDLQAILLGAAGVVLTGPLLPTNWMAKMRLECQPEALEIWGNVKSSAEVEGTHRTEVQPFGMNGEPLRLWSNAVALASKGREGAA